jgi:hypothetical protein
LVSEVLDELVVDVGYPGFQFDGYVLIEEVDAFLLFEHGFDFYQVLILQFTQQGHLLLHFLSLGWTHGVDLADEYSSVFGGALVAFSEGVVFLHDYYDLFGRHYDFINILMKKLISNQNRIFD